MQQIKLRCYIDIIKMEVILYYWERIAKPYTCTVASFSVHLLIIFNLILENRFKVSFTILIIMGPVQCFINS